MKGSSREPRRRPSQQPAFSNQLFPEQKRPCRAPETVGQTCLWTKQGHSAGPGAVSPTPQEHGPNNARRVGCKTWKKETSVEGGRDEVKGKSLLSLLPSHWDRVLLAVPACRLEAQKPCHTRARGGHGEPVTQGQTVVGSHKAFVSSLQQLSRRNGVLPFLSASGR